MFNMDMVYTIGEYELRFTLRILRCSIGLAYECVCGERYCYCCIISFKKRKYATLCDECVKKYKLLGNTDEENKKGFALFKMKGLI